VEGELLVRRSLTSSRCNTLYKVLKDWRIQGSSLGEEGFALASDGATFGISGKASK
jgi:hypothetical protein